MDERTADIKLFYAFCQNMMNAEDVDPAIAYLNYIINRLEMNEEQVLWLCFLYGCTYHLPAALVTWNEFPDAELADIPRLSKWWSENSHKIPWQVDKRKCKPQFVDTVASYQSIVGKSQKAYFDNLLNNEDPQVNFDCLWTPLKAIYCFGRFSTWNHAQALKHVAGYNIEPTKLMLGEPDAVSFTDGLAYAFNLHDKLTRKEPALNGKKKKVYYKWSEEEKQDMEAACSILKKSLSIDNFQLETIACAYKKVWREHESRYVGYYNDRMAQDINETEPNWPGVDWKLLWDCREECVPDKYRHNEGIDKFKFKLSPKEKIFM
jgi:hypothetical protein